MQLQASFSSSIFSGILDPLQIDRLITWAADKYTQLVIAFQPNILQISKPKELQNS